MSTFTRPLSPAANSSTRGNNFKLSSFVLKLNTMVNGAPDDVVSVSDNLFFGSDPVPLDHITDLYDESK